MEKSKNIGYTYEELDSAAREIAFISSGVFEMVHELLEYNRKLFVDATLRERGYSSKDKEYRNGKIFGRITTYEIRKLLRSIELDIREWAEPLRDKSLYEGLLLDELKAISDLGLLQIIINSCVYGAKSENWRSCAVCSEALYGVPYERAVEAIKQLERIVSHDLVQMSRKIYMLLKISEDNFSSQTFRSPFMLDMGLHHNENGTMC